MALQTLRQANLSEAKDAVQKAERWLQQTKPNNVLTAATLVLAFARDASEAVRRKHAESLQLLRRAQTQDGGWGPNADAPPECIDTALVLLAMETVRTQPGITAMIQRGRKFLLAQQNADGSWPATTRPSGGDSYAQMMSTTGWVTLALLGTRKVQKSLTSSDFPRLSWTSALLDALGRELLRGSAALSAFHRAGEFDFIAR